MADARIAILITLDADHEGGFQKHPNDHANWSSGVIGQGTLVGTNGGITALDMPGRDIEHLTTDEKVSYYLEHYWKPLYSEITSQLIASKLFDMGVLFGVGTAVENLQGALDVPTDGIFGPHTLLAANMVSDRVLLSEYQLKMRARAAAVAIMKPEEAGNLPGWIRRINS